MITIGVLLICGIGVMGFFLAARRGRAYSLDALEEPIKALLKRGYDRGFLVLKSSRSKVFVQFRKHIERKGKYRIELSLPNAGWSRSFFQQFRTHCDDNGIDYKIVEESNSEKMEFLLVDLRCDTRLAAKLARLLFSEIFGVSDSARYFVELENACVWDELIDDPRACADSTEKTLKRAVAYIRRSYRMQGKWPEEIEKQGSRLDIRHLGIDGHALIRQKSCMARPLRIDVADGWYHITNRGIERRRLYNDDRDYGHFLKLLGEMHKRYAVRVHAYVLMTNHYHLLIQTPKANASRAIQWLNVSYSAWYNRRHQRVGPLFQGRFTSVLIEGEGAWVLEACFYVHLNPIRIRRMGLDKKGQRAEGRGVAQPVSKQVKERLAVLRGYRWSSYRAYAGYGIKAEWLETGDVLRRSGGRERLRREVEEYIKQGVKEGSIMGLKARVLLGSQTFLESMKRRVRKVSKEQPDRKVLAQFVSWDKIVEIVERVHGKKWEEFRETHGDIGRDLVLYLARKRSGLTLREIGARASGMDYKGVGKAVERFRCRVERGGKLRAQTQRCLNQMSNVET